MPWAEQVAPNLSTSFPLTEQKNTARVAALAAALGFEGTARVVVEANAGRTARHGPGREAFLE